jgi:prepilin peptidase CpaA
MAAFAALGLAWVGLILLARIAWIDFRTFRIPNRDVAVLLAVAVAQWFALTGGTDMADLLAGLFLFVLGFLFWFFRLMGAGDAKLFLPLGIMIGWSHLLVFALCLLPASLLCLLGLRLARRWAPEGGALGGRLQEIARMKGVPYAVPLLMAALPALLPRLLNLS